MKNLFGWLKKSSAQNKQKKKTVSSARIEGRSYALLLFMGEKAGKENMEEIMDNVKTRIMVGLELAEKYPEDFKVVSALLKLKKELEESEKPLTKQQQNSDFLIGELEAGVIRKDNRPWSDLITTDEI
ncbi:MAG: hypothetical protein LUC88_06830 [Prevotella sp.]|nr:hypothetical protein [Prevotella sp.]